MIELTLRLAGTLGTSHQRLSHHLLPLDLWGTDMSSIWKHPRSQQLYQNLFFCHNIFQYSNQWFSQFKTKMVIWLPFRNKFHTSSTCPPLSGPQPLRVMVIEQGWRRVSLINSLRPARWGGSLRAVEIRRGLGGWMGPIRSRWSGHHHGAKAGNWDGLKKTNLIFIWQQGRKLGNELNSWILGLKSVRCYGHIFHACKMSLVNCQAQLARFFHGIQKLLHAGSLVQRIWTILLYLKAKTNAFLIVYLYILLLGECVVTTWFEKSHHDWTLSWNTF